ncbi:MAG: hypothetical protein MJ096_01105 [Clostridia bacterium]|nr:hypothetical protein [Clostridia bacterium]
MELEDMMKNLMNDPDFMGLVRRMKSDAGETVEKEEERPEAVSVSTSSGTENRNRLLLALKPYMSENRRGMIDAVTSLSKITGLLDFLPKKGTGGE